MEEKIEYIWTDEKLKFKLVIEFPHECVVYQWDNDAWNLIDYRFNAWAVVVITDGFALFVKETISKIEVFKKFVEEWPDHINRNPLVIIDSDAENIEEDWAALCSVMDIEVNYPDRPVVKK
ncbi:MAG: hypothetical protein KAJ19_03730 [Gammaproteobacteria bacterium]|nr:hypothetical protein [Gammaproteobacteria bacterium]